MKPVGLVGTISLVALLAVRRCSDGQEARVEVSVDRMIESQLEVHECDTVSFYNDWAGAAAQVCLNACRRIRVGQPCGWEESAIFWLPQVSRDR
jgi:hypothetical protein